MPGFLFAILLIVLFAGGSVLRLVPVARPDSDNWAQLPWWQQDPRLFLAHHAAADAMALGAFATMTLLTKNSFLDEIRKQYVMTARAKG
jgi:microcin C transport system permease protein